MGKCLSCCITHSAQTAQEQQNKYAMPSDGGPVESERALSDTITPGIGDAKSFAEKILFLPRSHTSTKGGDGKRASNSAVSDTKINALFQAYKDPVEDAILPDGIERLCQDLQIRPEEFKVLVLAFKFDVEQMCRFSRKEFVEGCRLLRVDSLSGLQSRLVELEAEASDPVFFKELYRFTFRFGLEIGQRILPTEMALQLWRLVFSQRDVPILERWIQFLESHPHVRGIPRDTWNMFLNFVEAVGSDLSAYDDTEAWPCLLDDFVEYEHDQANQNVHKDKPLS